MPRSKVTHRYCCICGQASEQRIFMGTSMARPPDLDMRPGSPHRETMPYWLQRCPTCGYCAPDIRQCLMQQRGPWRWLRRLYEPIYGTVRTIVRGTRYQDQLTSPMYPPLANHFRCCATLQTRLGSISQASHWMLCAAWVCDDAKMTEAAHQCRQQAALLLARAIRTHTAQARECGLSEVILVDILRRTGQFRQAQRWCVIALQHDLSEMLQRICKGQQNLIDKRDQGSYTIADLIGAATYQRLVRDSYARRGQN